MNIGIGININSLGHSKPPTRIVGGSQTPLLNDEDEFVFTGASQVYVTEE